MLHIHWDDRIFGRSGNPEVDKIVLSSILEKIEDFKTRGGIVIWTIHNRVPHKIRNLETFHVARHNLCRLANLIHVHADHAKAHLIDTYRAPSKKIWVNPHPSYLGAYEPEDVTLNRVMPRLNARSFLLFGMFRDIEVLQDVVNAAQKLSLKNRGFHLRMYGRAFKDQMSILNALADNPNADIRTVRVPDREVPEIFANSQVFLAPNRKVFTSGSVMLALTFGLPVIGPNIRQLRETTPLACHKLLYDPASPHGLEESMNMLIDMKDDELESYRHECIEFSKQRSPSTIGNLFRETINRVSDIDSPRTRTSVKRDARASVNALKQTALKNVLGKAGLIHITDIGVNPMGSDPPYKTLYEQGAVVLTGFDPQANTLETLHAHRNSQDTFLPYAVGDGKNHDLKVYNGSGLTSLLRVRRNTLFFLMGLKKAARHLDTVPVKTKRLEDISEIQEIDMLKIDVQGAEPMIIRHGVEKLKSTVAIHAEVNFFPLYDGQPGLGELDSLLRKQGFYPHSFYHTVKRSVHSKYLHELKNPNPTHLLDGDLIYFRDLSDAARLSNDQLRKLALISDGIYGFFDFTLRCIDELEKRNQVNVDAIPEYIECLNRTPEAEPTELAKA